MKTFREFVDNRDTAAVPVPGQMRAATNRYTKSWDQMVAKNPDQAHDRFLNPRRLRSGVAGTAQQYADLAGDPSELARARTNAMGAVNRVFQARRKEF